MYLKQRGVKKINSIRSYRKIKKMSEKELLYREIEEVRFLIKYAYFKLSQATEKELVESAVLELRSLELKHAYLLNRIKEVEK